MTTLKTFLVSALALLGTGGIAMAQETVEGPYSYGITPYYDGATGAYDWSAPGLPSGIGVDVTAGGGVGGFTNQTMRDVTSNVMGLWNVRVGIGTHVPIGVDITYMGSASNVNALIGPESGTLIGTSVEGTLRWNILPHENFNPYIFGGAGWQHYDVTSGHFTLADNGMNSSDNLADFPVGAGLSFRLDNGLVISARGTYRFTVDPNLVLKTPTVAFTNIVNSNIFEIMDSWEGSAQIGFEW